VKFLVIENVATSMARLLRSRGHDVKIVQQAGLTGAEDERVLATVPEERVMGRAVVVEDAHIRVSGDRG
jgi:hypothetical protein